MSPQTNAATTAHLTAPAAASQNNDQYVSMDTPAGRRTVSPVQLASAVCSTAPSAFMSLSDDIPASASKKRSRKAVQRTLLWLDQCLALVRSGAVAAAPPGGMAAEGAQARDRRGAPRAPAVTVAADAGPPCAALAPAQAAALAERVLGVVVGGSDVEARRHSARETALRPVAGFVLGGFGTGETLAERSAALASAIAQLPVDKPRLLFAVGAPLEVLEAVSLGVDVFDSVYPASQTEAGYASTFWVGGDGADGGSLSGSSSGSAGGDSGVGHRGGGVGKINLRDRGFARDTLPLVPGCDCFTCLRHSRAYVHHLLNAQEMLGEVLLFAHNMRRYIDFFAAIRQSLASGQFDAFRAEFERRYAPEKLGGDVQQATEPISTASSVAGTS